MAGIGSWQCKAKPLLNTGEDKLLKMGVRSSPSGLKAYGIICTPYLGHKRDLGYSHHL